MDPEIPNHPKFGAALTRDEFPGSSRQYSWYKAICQAILIATDPGQTMHVSMGVRAFKTGVKRMWDTGALDSAPRKRATTVYTNEVMQAAYDLVRFSGELLNFKDLFILVRSEGYLEDCGNLACFRAAFKAYCEGRGEPLTVNSTRTTFYLATNDYPIRAAYAKSMLELLKTRPLKRLIFVDEVTLEECPHPKGKQLLHAFQPWGQIFLTSIRPHIN